MPNGEESGGFGDVKINEIVINYQDLYILENRTTVSWFLNDTCSESFEVRGYTLNTGEPVLSQDHVFAVGNASSFTISSEQYTNNEGVDINYRLVALDENRNVCSSTRDIYYRFDGM